MSLDTPPLLALIFDLDDTLLDTSRLLIPIARSPEFERRIAEPLPLMEGALENLEFLAKKYHLSLVTQGNPRVQRTKIQSLGVASYFNRIEIVDSSVDPSKLRAFKAIPDATGIDASRIMSIGNRRSSDIRAAKALGMRACLFRHGEHQSEVPEGPDDIPDFEVAHHRDLIKVCSL